MKHLKENFCEKDVKTIKSFTKAAILMVMGTVGIWIVSILIVG